MQASDSLPKILHVSTPTSWRGGEQQMIYLFEELARIGVEQQILCRKDSAVESYCKKQGLNHHSSSKVTGLDPFFAREIARYCTRNGVDIVHTHDAHAHTFAILAADLFGLKSSIVVSRRVDFPIKKSRFSHYKYNHPRVAKIVCVSDAIQEITGRDIRKKAVLTTVHSGIDVSRFSGKTSSGILRKTYRISDDECLIGNVAAIAPHKDYFTFLDTALRLKKQDVKVKFLVIGDGPMRDEVETYAQKLGLAQDVIFTGFRKDIPDVLPELDVFLITSETEGLGTSILDAFACRVPVVATAAGGIPEIVRHEQSGLLGEIKQPGQLAEQVLRLIKEQDLRNSLTEGALTLLQEFTKEATAAKTLSVYCDL